MSNNNNEDNATRNFLPLEPKEKKYSSDKIGKFKVQTDPTDNNSVKYDFAINHSPWSTNLILCVGEHLVQYRMPIRVNGY